MDEYLLKDFVKIIKKNAVNMRHELYPAGTNAMRIYNLNLEPIPLTIDLYGSYARVEDWGDSPLSNGAKAEVLDAIHRYVYVDADKIVYIYREKLSDHKQHTADKSDSVEGRNDLGVISEDQGDVSLIVKENNLQFKVNLSAYTDTGLFLDQAGRRALVRDASDGKRVLNLFSYTGSFSVYAASGGAECVKSVDLSNTYTLWAEENLKMNGYEGKGYSCVASDAKSFVEKEIESGSRYDIILFDPPVFSNSHKMDYTFNVQRDYKSWITMLYKILSVDGFILFSTNLSTFVMDKKVPRGLKITDITDETRALGFTKKGIQAVCYLLVKDVDVKGFEWRESVQKSGFAKGARNSGARKGSAGGKYGRDSARSDFRKGEAKGEYGKPSFRSDFRKGEAKGEYGRVSARPDYKSGAERKHFRKDGDNSFDREMRTSSGRRETFDRESRTGHRDFDRKGKLGSERRSFGRDLRTERREFDRDSRTEYRSFSSDRNRPEFDRDSRTEYRSFSSDRNRRDFDRDSRTEYRSFSSDRNRPEFDRETRTDNRPSGSERRPFDRETHKDRRVFDHDRETRTERHSFNTDHRPSKPIAKSKPYGYGGFRSARNRSDLDEYYISDDRFKED